MDALRPRGSCPFSLSCEDKDGPLRSSGGKLSCTETLCLTTLGLCSKDFGWYNGQASDSFLQKKKKKTQCRERLNIHGSRRNSAHNENVAKWAIWRASAPICIGGASMEPPATADSLIGCRLRVGTAGSDLPFTCCRGRTPSVVVPRWRRVGSSSDHSSDYIKLTEMPSYNADVEFWCVNILKPTLFSFFQKKKAYTFPFLMPHKLRITRQTNILIVVVVYVFFVSF